MSLINQMLQDLDKRQSAAAVNNVAQADIRVAPGQRTRLRLVWWAALLLTVALLSAGIAWLFWRRAAPAPAPAPAPIVAVAKPAVSVSPTRQNALPRASSTPDQPAPREKDAVVSIAAAPDVPVFAAIDSSAQKTPETTLALVKPPARTTASKPLAAAVQKTAPVLHAKTAAPTVPAMPTHVAKNAKEFRDVPVDQDSAVFKQAKEVTPQQSAENSYRKALSLIDAGQLPEAIGILEQVLLSNPKHAAARQTLAGLLLESKRQDEAVRTLQEGLTIDPAQPGLAMILARLQIERGHLRPALETLQRTLPYAAEQADYQAFLAALLQREKRHKEAAEHYAVALRKVPQNSLWWMGYGISLQADNRLAEAQDAFTRAKASNTLSPELQAFVDQKLRQIQP
ncbi:MAG: tetratricopeptide repeat protein [Glaciimonas sp.]|nr:tetratricopeptide repeat protein [Glaciimonas sp.]